MKFLITALAFFLIFTCSGQSPNSFKYQAMMRSATGQPLSDKNISLRISILQGATTGSSVYVETHNAKTTTQGIVNLEIGKGTIVSGNLSIIAWGSGTYFVKIEMDPTGGSAFELAGISQLLSVPYALYAQKSGDEKWNSVTGGINFDNGNVGIGKANPVTKLDISGTVNANGFTINGQTLNNIWNVNGANANSTITGNIGIGTTNPLYKLDVVGTINASQLLINGLPTTGPGPWVVSGSNVSYSVGNVGIGTGNPAVKLDIDGGSDLNLLNLRNSNNSLGINASVYSNTDFHGSAIIGKRARGAFSSPSNVFTNDRVTGLYGSMFLDGAFQNAGAIQMYVGQNPGVSSYPINIRFETTDTNQTTRIERMRIAENGLVKVTTNDVYINNIGSGVIMKSPNGQCWRMTVDNTGAPVFTSIPCPQ